MKLSNRNLEMTCNLVLTEREIEMLGYLAGFGASNIAEAIHGKLTSKFSKDEWEILWSEMREKLESTHSHLSDVRQVFLGQKRATQIEKVVNP